VIPACCGGDGGTTTPPVTNPVLDPTVATVESVLLQTPPGVKSDNMVVCPEHMVVTPAIGAGNGFTVTVVVIEQVVGKVYVITVVPPGFPAPPLLTTPLPDPTVATDDTLLLHVPPDRPLLNVVVNPAHIVVLPAIVVGNGLTVTDTDLLQPVGKMSVIVAVPPGAPPVMIAVLTPIGAITTLLLLHVPPIVLSVNAMVDPTQTDVGPIITPGNGFTVTVVVTLHPARV
jgi:hypothetical protein